MPLRKQRSTGQKARTVPTRAERARGLNPRSLTPASSGPILFLVNSRPINTYDPLKAIDA